MYTMTFVARENGESGRCSSSRNDGMYGALFLLWIGRTVFLGLSVIGFAKDEVIVRYAQDH